jgi:hypothetical protein
VSLEECLDDGVVEAGIDEDSPQIGLDHVGKTL